MLMLEINDETRDQGATVAGQRALKWLLILILILSSLLGCASPPPDQAFDKVRSARLQKLLILQVPETKLAAINLGSGYDAFGLVGGLLGESDEQAKSSRFEASIRQQAGVGEALTTALSAELRLRGFEVEVGAQRPASNAGPDTAPVNETFDYSAIRTRADAILHVSFVRAGYLATAGSTHYKPWLYVRARLVSADSHALLYSQLIVYGAKFPETTTYIPAPTQYAYGDFDSLIANPGAAAAGLRAGAAPMAAGIAGQLR
jgi:hypothetical protein